MILRYLENSSYEVLSPKYQEK
jgi:hypothetical protein